MSSESVRLVALHPIPQKRLLVAGFGLIALVVLLLSAGSGHTSIELAAVLLLGVAAAFAAFALAPPEILPGWGLVLLVYVAWPTAPRQYVVAHLSVEYVALLAVGFSIVLSGFLRHSLEFQVLPRRLVLLAIGFLGYAAVSGLWSVDRVTWAEYLAMWVIYLVLLAGLIAALAPAPRKSLIEGLTWLAWCSAIFGLVGFARTQLTPLLTHTDAQMWAFFSPLVRFRISEAIILLTGVPAALVAYHATGRSVHLIAVAVLSLAILFSFSRTGMVGLAVLVVLIGLFVARPLALRALGWLAAAGVLLAGLWLAHVPVVVDLFNRVASTSLITRIWFGNIGTDDPGGGRQVLLLEGWRIFRGSPFVGTGVGNYMAHFNYHLPTTATTPHNLYLMSLAEYGIIGSLLVLSLLIGFAIVVWVRAIATSDRVWRSAAVGFASLVASFWVMGLASEFFTVPYFWFALGLAGAIALVAPEVGRDTATRPWPATDRRTA